MVPGLIIVSPAVLARGVMNWLTACNICKYKCRIGKYAHRLMVMNQMKITEVQRG